jgi:hypothetical protein
MTPKAKKKKPAKQEIAAEPPVDIVIRFWRDRAPEILMSETVAPWLVAATLAEAAEMITDMINAEASNEAEKET